MIALPNSAIFLCLFCDIAHRYSNHQLVSIMYIYIFLCIFNSNYSKFIIEGYLVTTRIFNLSIINMIVTLIVVFTFLTLRFILYLFRYIQINNLYSRYKVYLKEPYLEFNQYKPQIINLFKQAGLTDNIIPRMEPAGYGKLRSYNTNLFSNIANVNPEIIPQTHMKFHEAIGIFRYEMIKTVNPISWLEFIFKLPEYLLGYFGVSKESIITKIVNIIYWISAIIFGLFKVNLLQIIREF